MGRVQPWTAAEFEQLLLNPGMDDGVVAQQVGRTSGAVGVVRAFVCAYHRGLNTSGLSRMMLVRLNGSRAALSCAACGEQF